MVAMERVRALGSEQPRDMTDFGHEFVALRVGGAAEAAGAAERWRDAGGTHFAAVSMGLGLDSIEAHLEFMRDVANRLGLSAS